MNENVITTHNAFNRTILELKYLINDCEIAEVDAFNRTILELKLDTDGVITDIFLPFNRTILELKLAFVVVGCFAYYLSIVQYLN